MLQYQDLKKQTQKMKTMGRLHEYFMQKNKIYLAWHDKLPYNYIHLSVLILSFFLLTGIMTNEIHLYQSARANNSNILSVNPSYTYLEPTDDKLISINLSNTFLIDNHLQLNWTSDQSVKYVSINLIDIDNQFHTIAPQIINRNFFSAMVEANNYQFIQLIGYDQNHENIENIHFNL
ncbi:hypothetical protein KJ855_04895 [Patescibacteria group bacterium]|nr:hypothetical protein [Patescibacteria group bacterium]